MSMTRSSMRPRSSPAEFLTLSPVTVNADIICGDAPTLFIPLLVSRIARQRENESTPCRKCAAPLPYWHHACSPYLRHWCHGSLNQEVQCRFLDFQFCES